MPITDSGLYIFEDIAFVNSAEFSRSAQHYKEHNCYTYAPPDSKEYKDFWDLEEDRLRNGMKMPGKLVTVKETKIIDGTPRIFTREELQTVHITGKHYGFLNYGRILLTKDKDTGEEEPNGEEINFLTGNKLKHAKKVGKKSIDFPRFIDGQYHWFKAKEYSREIGLHIVAAKARRKGFSYMEGWDCAHEINLTPDITCLVAAYDMKYLTKGNQIMPMAKRYLDWLELKTDFNRGFLKEEKDHFKLGYKNEGSGHIEFGFKSEMIAVSLMNNPDAAAGKDAVLIKFEESGKNPLLKEALSITMSTTEDGSYITGHIDIFGTGGTKDANWADFEEIYYNPHAHGCMAFDNIWDEGCAGTRAGFFYPQQIGDPAFVDSHGNSLQAEALAAHVVNKEWAKKNKSQSDYVRWVGQRATCPKEAFASGSDNIFPTAEIIDQKSRVEHDPDYKYLPRIGTIVNGDRGLKVKMNEMIKNEGYPIHEPIFNFPLKPGQDLNGCYVEWQSPYRDPSTGKIPDGLYRIWHDPYAHDKGEKELTIRDSLGASYIYERLNNFTPSRGDIIVGCYVGRPARMDDYNEELFKLAQYWNAQIMFENDRGDVKQFAGRHRKLHMLADEPDLEWVAELKGKTNRGKGMNMTDKRKAKAAIYLRDWLLERRGKDAYGNEKLNLHYIYDPALLSELLKWNIKGNFDRVSALLIGMFDMKECFQREIKMPTRPDKSSFFERGLFGS